MRWTSLAGCSLLKCRRHSGSPGVTPTTFDVLQRRIRSTRVNSVMDRGLHPVLRTRPSLPPPHLPALHRFRCGAYLFVSTRLCLRLPSGPHRCDTLAIGYPSPPSGWVWTLFTSCVIFLSEVNFTIEQSELPGTQRDRDAPHGAPLPPHRTYGSRIRRVGW